MGVDRDFYVLFGYEVDYSIWNNLLYTALNAEDVDMEIEIDKWFVADGMSGDYAYFGKTLHRSGENEHNKHDIIFIPTNDEISKVRQRYIEMIGDEPEDDPKIIAFEHYY